MHARRFTESLDALADQLRIRKEMKREYKKAVRAIHTEKRQLQKKQRQYDNVYKKLLMENDLENERNEAAEEKMKQAGEADEKAHRTKKENERSARETAQFEAFKRIQETMMKLCRTIMMGKKGTDGENTEKGR